MVIIPNLTDDGPSRVVLTLTSLGGIVPGARAANVRLRAGLLGQGFLNVCERIRGLIARHDFGLVQPLPGRVALVVLDRGLEEIDNVLVLDVVRAIAGDVEGGVASRVLAELVGPEVSVGRALVDPVRVHPVDQVVAAEGLQERVDRGAVVVGDHGAVGEAVGRIRRGDRVVLALQVAVLSVRAVAEVGPQAVQCPCVGGQLLAFGFESCPCRPELCEEDEPTVRLGAAGVDLGGIGAGRT